MRGPSASARPIETIVYPGLGDVPETVSSVTPPRASSDRPAVPLRDGRAHSSGRHVVEQDPRCAPAASASSSSARSRTSTSTGRSGARPPRAACTAAPTPPASAEWFSLIRISSNRPMRWFVAAAGGHRGLLEHPQAGRRLARVEDARAGALDLAHAPPRGQRRDAREAPEEVERRALGGRAARGRGPGSRSTGPPSSRHTPSSTAAARVAHVRVERAEHPLGDVEPVDDAGRLLADRRDRAPASAATVASAGHVAGADVLGQGAGDQLVEQPRVERWRMRGGRRRAPAHASRST